jgi:glyoxylase-like metal-dependent hydrolase (beta-lactamase superfamily II)
MADILIKQIKQGFVDSDKKTWISACSSVTLIRTRKKNILVDTGSRGYFNEIKKNLKKEGLEPLDIDIVINTHSHSDHNWNNAYFEKADIVVFNGILKDKFYWKKLPLELEENISVISTPGHSYDSCSVIVKTEKGVYAITGDLFHSTKDKIPSFEKDISEIQKNRQRVIEIADFIIPGHGEMFKAK